MASPCYLPTLPGELRNHIYDSIHALEGIVVIASRTQVHALGRTCQKLHHEVTSRTSAYAEKGVSVVARAQIYDFDFQNLKDWLNQHPFRSPSASLDTCVRKLKLKLVIRPSDSPAGLPYENEEHLYSLFPTPKRRLELLKRNFDLAQGFGRWSKNCHAENNATFGEPGHGRARPARLDMHHLKTSCSYLVEITVEMMEPASLCYEACWPKPRPGLLERIPSYARWGDLDEDYLELIDNI